MERKINISEMATIHEFFQSLINDDTELFLSAVSSSDKYYLLNDLNADSDMLEDIMEEIKENYSGYIERVGIANTITFENHQQTKGYVVVVENVTTEVRYLKETEINGVKLPVELEEGRLKVKIFLEN